MDSILKNMKVPLATYGPNPNPGGCDIAVGDIHGCFAKLELALKAIGFDPEVDRLFCVGDLVDRGPESKDVLAWLAKPWLHSICGNHEFLTFRAAKGEPYPDVDHKRHGGLWLYDMSKEERLAVAEALAALPLAMEVQTSQGLVGFVHADCPFDDWDEMRGVHWSQRDGSIGFYDLCLWSTERRDRSYQGVVKNVRAVVHGHVVVKSHLVLGNAHFIDSGGWIAGKKFTLLDLETLAPAKPRRRG